MLIGALERVPRERRAAVQYPEPEKGRLEGFRTLEEALRLDTGPQGA